MLDTVEMLERRVAEEMHDAEEYAALALEYKKTDAELAQVFFTLSSEELRHATMLHEQAWRLVAARGNASDAESVAARAVYDYTTRRNVADMQDVSALHARFRK